MAAFENTIALDKLPDDQEATVVSVRSNDGALTEELLRRLIDIGFLPGERVRVIARGVPGGTPLAVRVGTSTFALRRPEAQCVQVTPVARAASTSTSTSTSTSASAASTATST